METVNCPICASQWDGSCWLEGPGSYDCEVCGRYSVSSSAIDQSHRFLAYSFDQRARAALAYRVHQANSNGQEPQLTTYWLAEFAKNPSLPNPALQVTAVIRRLGDHQKKTGNTFRRQLSTWVEVGAYNRKMFSRLLKEMEERNLIRLTGNETAPRRSGGTFGSPAYELTLDGWQRYEEQAHGRSTGNYGFIALKFRDPTLDPFLEEVIKPAVKDGLGYELIDLRDVSQAGVIDNLMRATIRDSAFVLADLTHENAGAYWEAGYAEGIGKPVVYLCEATKFESAQTHFDTNHSTTVLWSTDKAQQFQDELVATLRRSLNLFA